MITDRGMIALRVGAALASSIPQLRVRLRHHDEILLDVVAARDADGPLQMAACAFHHAVARAYLMHQSGERMRFMALPLGAEPTIDLGVATGDLMLPDSVLRIQQGDVWMHVMATPRSLNTCVEITSDLAANGVIFQPDATLDVTMVVARCRAGDERRSERAFEAVREVAARCVIADVEDHLRAAAGVGADPWRGGSAER